MNDSLAGVDNFRSLRGLPTADGRQVAGHTLLRSDHLARLTDEDWTALQGIGLKTVCDLRSHAERLRHPNKLPGPHIRELQFNLITDLRADPRFAQMLTADDGRTDGERAADMMMRVYRGLPHALAPNLRELFDVLDVGHVPLLVHCTAGKDRTGFTVAVLLHALGATPQTILEDYLQTRHSPLLTQPERLARLQASLHEMIGHCSDGILAAVLDVREAYLQSAFDEVARHWGSLDGYLEREAGLTADRIVRLRDRYLTEPAA